MPTLNSDEDATQPRCSSVLFEDHEKGLVLLDIPRSLEESQILPGCIPERRIFSTDPPSEPFRVPEPRRTSEISIHGGGSASEYSAAAQLADLMTEATVCSAIQHLQYVYTGAFLLPRMIPSSIVVPNPGAVLMCESAEYVQGTIQDTKGVFHQTAPEFDLIIMDPPWPNRSARRKTNGYRTANSIPDIRRLLSAIPIGAHLKPKGLVAVWVTNKPSILDLMTSRNGLFAQWGLELVTEWTWLKITSSGQPLTDINSAWRKPWEKLLIAQRVNTCKLDNLKPIVLVAVPDLHSRKPNMRTLFQRILGHEFKGLEVFARNLTAGWWSWGNETLLYQQSQYWSSPQH